MGALNSCNFVGRVTKTPEISKSGNGKEYCSFTIAVKKEYKGANGEYGVDFLNCIIWGGRAKYMGYIKPTDVISVQGSAQQSTYTKEGGDTVNSITFNISSVSKVSSGDSDNSNNNNNETQEGNNDEFYESSKELATGEDMPF